MRWELLFADLEARVDAAERADLDVEIAERTRDERAGIELAGRLVHARGESVTVTVRGGARVSGSIADAAGTWVLLATAGGDALVPLVAVAAIEGIGHRASPLTHVETRLPVSSVLRELAETRAAVLVETDGGAWQGRIAAVGSDHLDLDGPGGLRAIPLRAVLVVRARG
ncbi:hypothetical protein [Demequina sp.]|uniref:hypothetical protein n=1 Tax=Demequina sp. TaxID=2050685 RepID=UPI0025CEDE56|nr:hypothetical protein [Demequina sp.]